MVDYNPQVYEYFQRRLTALEKERQSFDYHWKDLSENIQPRRGRFFVQDRNRGWKRHNLIVNSTATRALRTATSGLLAGIMSPTRPWFNLDVTQQELGEKPAVKIWLSEVERRMRAIFNQSNLYNMAPSMLSELLLFGTGCMLHVNDKKDIARFYTQTVGSYFLAQNDRHEIDTLYREFQMQVGAMVKQFGLRNVSTQVQRSYDLGDYDLWHDVCHAIEPRVEGSARNPFSTNKPFRSIYFEKTSISEKSSILRESGFDHFPAYCPRWDLTGEDIYGTNCPGMIVLGDVRQLQVQEKRKAQAIDKMVNPPLKAPPSFRNVPVSTLPGGLTVYDEATALSGGLEPVYQVNPQVNHLVMDIEKTEMRIKDTFYIDLFLAITDMEGIQPRNQLEIMQRNEERLLQLGPVLEQLHGEFLDKLVDRTFIQLQEAGGMPKAPPELEGQVLKVNYISSLAQAQRAVATGSIERIATFIGGMAEVFPNISDKFDADQAVDEYSSAILAPPRIVRSDEDVAAIREQRAAEAEQAKALEAMTMGAEMAKTASETSANEQNRR